MRCSLGVPEQNAIKRDLAASRSKANLTSLSRWGDRESSLVRHLANYRYLNGAHIQAFLFEGTPITLGSRAVLTRRVVGRLKRQGLVQETPRLVGPAGGAGRLVYFLTAAGYAWARSLDPGLPARRPAGGTALMGHGLACADVALAFRRAAAARPDHAIVDWACDWQAAARLGASYVVPDAHFVYGAGDVELEGFIEVDLGTEGSRVFARKIERYLELWRDGTWGQQLRCWPVVLTITTTAARATALRRATATVLAGAFDRDRVAVETEFRFAVLPDVLGPYGPLGPIWQTNGQTARSELIRNSALDLPRREGSLT